MKYWLDIPCSELPMRLLVDEHRSIHAYFGSMLKDPEKRLKHPIIGPMDPRILRMRHDEEVTELEKRGSGKRTTSHNTYISWKEVSEITAARAVRGCTAIGTFLSKGMEVIIDEDLRKLQTSYFTRTNSGPK